METRVRLIGFYRRLGLCAEHAVGRVLKNSQVEQHLLQRAGSLAPRAAHERALREKVLALGLLTLHAGALPRADRVVGGRDGDAPGAVLMVDARNVPEVGEAAAGAAHGHPALDLAGGRAHDRLVAHIVPQRLDALGSLQQALVAHPGRHAGLCAGGRKGFIIHPLPVMPHRRTGHMEFVIAADPALEQVISRLRAGGQSHFGLLEVVRAVRVQVPAVRIRPSGRAECGYQQEAAQQTKRSLHFSSPLYHTDIASIPDIIRIESIFLHQFLEELSDGGDLFTVARGKAV